MNATDLKFKYVILSADYYGDDLNDWSPTGLSCKLHFDTANESDVLKQLIKTGYFGSSANLKDVDIDFEDEDNIYVTDKENGRVICKLMRVGE